MAQQPDPVDRMITLIERLVGVLVETRTPAPVDEEGDSYAKYVEAKKKKNAMDAEGAHDGHEIGGPGYPRPYVG